MLEVFIATATPWTGTDTIEGNVTRRNPAHVHDKCPGSGTDSGWLVDDFSTLGDLEGWSVFTHCTIVCNGRYKYSHHSKFLALRH